MATTILSIFFLIFTTTYAFDPPCMYNQFCRCLSYDIDDIKVMHTDLKGLRFRIKVKSLADLQIVCKDMQEWQNLNVTTKQFHKQLDLLEFTHCPLPTETSLKDAMENFGIETTKTLIFRSFKDLDLTLNKEHFQGFSNMTKLVLSDNSLNDIPAHCLDDLSKLTYLDLSKNELTVLGIGIFDTLENLKYLNLLGNTLEELNEQIFMNQPFLRYLILSFNSLSELPQLIFHSLINLEIIDLSSNNFIDFPSNLFEKNQYLKQVIMNDNKMKLLQLPDYFLGNLLNLNTVYLIKNGMRRLPENLFWGSVNLEKIYLSNNLLDTIPLNFFKNLSKVKELNLQNNNLLFLPDGVFQDLEQLKVLNLAQNKLMEVRRNLLDGLTSLQVINMDYNQLTYIDPEALSKLVNLRTAKFSNNMLEFGSPNNHPSPFYNNSLIKHLYLSNNQICNFFPDWAITSNDLRILDLSNNRINILVIKDLFFSSDSVVVDLRYNLIETIFLNDLTRLAMHHTKERDVIVDVEHNPISCDCFLYDFLRYCQDGYPISVYNYIELKEGDLACLYKNGTKGPKIKEIDYKTYQCSEDEYFSTKMYCPINCTCGIRMDDKVRIFDCSNKNMERFTIYKDTKSFGDRYPLIVNLTGNRLKELPIIQDLHFVNVISLLLSNNNISKISYERLPKDLKVLELHNNNIARIDAIVIRNWKVTTFKELTLSGNPFICDCETNFLLRLLQKKRFFHIDLENVKCKDKSIPLVRMTVSQLCSEKNSY